MLRAVNNGASEMVFALGDAVGDGDSDGDGMDISDIGLNGPVEPGDLEPRDRADGESPRPSGGKIVRGGH